MFKKMTANAIGIDLGTTSSLAAIMESGKANVILNNDGERVTDTRVSFTDTNYVVGRVAKYVSTNPENIIFDVRKLLGRTWGDPVLQKCIHHLPYNIINDNGLPKIKVEDRREIRLYSPEDIISLVLTTLKDSAEIRLNKKVRKAVITVPTYFDDKQRMAVKKAATISGLKVLDLLLEPIAAVMAYKLDDNKERKVFVFDFGGASVSASIVTVRNGIYKVLATDTNMYVGSEDFDNRLFIEMVKMLKRKHELDITQNETAVRRLKEECTRAKHFLSSTTCVDIVLHSIFPNIDFTHMITRTSFEYMNRDLFEAAMQPVQKVLQDAKTDRLDINDVVLAGGATRMAKVREVLQKMFPDKELHGYITPEEVVVEGAARHAATLDCYEHVNDNPMFVNATTQSLGIETSGGMMSIIVPKLSIPPVKYSKTFTTCENEQPAVTIRIFQGERAITGKNQLLYHLDFEIPPAPKGMFKIEVTFKINRDFVFEVTVEELFLCVKKTFTIEKYGIDLFVEEDRLKSLDEEFEDVDHDLWKEVTNAIEYLPPKKMKPKPKVVNLG